MTQRDKLLAKIRSHPKNVRFDDLQTLLGYYGYQARPGQRQPPQVSAPGFAAGHNVPAWRACP